MAKTQGEILIGPDGSIAIRTTTGNFATGADLIKLVADRIQAQGVTLDREIVPEQHRHDDPGSKEHARPHTHVKALDHLGH